MNDMRIGQRGKIVQINDLEVKIALMNLGVQPGEEFEITNIAPFGDPIAFTVNGVKVALRKADAAKIEVEPA